MREIAANEGEANILEYYADGRWRFCFCNSYGDATTYCLCSGYMAPPEPLLLVAVPLLLVTVKDLKEGVAYQPCDEKGDRGKFNFNNRVGVFEKLSGEGWPVFRVADRATSMLNHKYFVKI